MGMDIVQVEDRGTQRLVESTANSGKGTTITIKLPLTLAILPSLMVEIDGDAFAIPLESVLEIVHVDRCDVSTVHGQQVVSVRDRIVAVLSLGSIFTMASGVPARPPPRANLTAMVLVIIGEKQRQLGLAVDRVLGEEDVVIKSIAENYRNVAGVAGASILGDGRISLILDPTTLIEMSSHPTAAAAAS